MVGTKQGKLARMQAQWDEAARAADATNQQLSALMHEWQQLEDARRAVSIDTPVGEITMLLAHQARMELDIRRLQHEHTQQLGEATNLEVRLNAMRRNLAVAQRNLAVFEHPPAGGVTDEAGQRVHKSVIATERRKCERIIAELGGG